MSSVSSLTPPGLLAAFESLIRRDPARRGLLADDDVPLCPGHLAAAAEHLAAHAGRVAIVTGFAVPSDAGPVCETDGPPGSALLATALASLGIEVRILTDDVCRPVVAAAARLAGLPASLVQACPVPAAAAQTWIADFFADDWTRGLTHLIAVERVGPSHTRDSVLSQIRSGPPPGDEFELLVQAAGWGRSHNMRGQVIEECTAPLHLLFEQLPARLPAARAIGVCDGGNEIGVGNLLWEEVQRRLPPEIGPRIVCRTLTDWTILAGVSNWGAAALGLGTLVSRQAIDPLRFWTAAFEEELIAALVAEAGAVDGFARAAAPTVDGLPHHTYIEPWQHMRRLVGWD